MSYSGPSVPEGSPSWERRIKPLGDPILDDFRNHLYLCLRAVLGVKPTALQYDVGEYLQYGPQLRIIFGFRGMSKSWISAFFTDWLAARNFALKDGHPDINVLVASGTKDRAENFTTFTRELFYHVDHLNHLVPADIQRWSLSNFDVSGSVPSQNATVASRAIFGRMAGDRADVIVGDDLELPQNAETQGQRDKLARRIADFQNILKPGGEVVLLGTPHFEDTAYARLKENGYSRRIWPGRVPEPAEEEVYMGDLAPFIRTVGPPGSPVEPTRFDEEELRRAESAGRSVFRMQWMLDPSLGDETRYPLKLRDLIVCDLDPDVGPDRPVWSGGQEQRLDSLPCVGMRGDSWQAPLGFGGPGGRPSFSPYTGVVCAIDPSGKGANETAWSVVASLGSYLYLLDVGADVRGYDPPVLARILSTLRATRCRHVVYEENYGGGMFGSVLGSYLTTAGYPCTIEPVRHSQMKEGRIIDSLEPVTNSHRLVVNTSVATQDAPRRGDEDGGHRYRLWHQFTRIERVKGALAADDRLDSLAIGVSHWTAQMRVDHEATVASIDAERHSKAIQRFWARKNRRSGRSAGAGGVTSRSAGFSYGRRSPVILPPPTQ